MEDDPLWPTTIDCLNGDANEDDWNALLGEQLLLCSNATRTEEKMRKESPNTIDTKASLEVRVEGN